MKVLLLTTDQPNQIALAHRLAERVDLCAVACSANRSPGGGRSFASRIRAAIANRTAGAPFTAAWRSLQGRYELRHPGGFPASLSLIEVPEVNDPATLNLVRAVEPDLIAVSGTNLVKSALIREAESRGGMVNLHTGISPYVKGGPNCTNWCLAEGWFHLIGSSVMWIDEGIDSGRLIFTERTALTGEEELAELHWRVMEHAHEMYVAAIEAIAAGNVGSGVRQGEIGAGRTFRNREWTMSAARRARLNFSRRYRDEMPKAQRVNLRLVPLVDS